jgi:peptidoglycan hydrolase CwlO-like protein
MIGDFESEIERLKAKKAEINSKIASTRNFDVKEKLKEEMVRIENQIKILEDMKRRTR